MTRSMIALYDEGKKTASAAQPAGPLAVCGWLARPSFTPAFWCGERSVRACVRAGFVCTYTRSHFEKVTDRAGASVLRLIGCADSRYLGTPEITPGSSSFPGCRVLHTALLLAFGGIYQL